jgi:parvulin-like peptidyl-prolyl isomerase
MFRNIIAALILSSFSSMAFAQVVAKIGNREITLEAFKRRYAEIKRETVNAPTPEVFLDDLVRFEMGVQMAEENKLADDAEVKEKIRRELYKAFVEKEIGKKVDAIKVTDGEMRTYYSKNPDYRSSHILISVKPGATPEQRDIAKKRATEIFKEVKASKRPFEELVKIYSDDTFSKVNGGDVGYQNRISSTAAYYETLSKLKMGEIAGPVASPFGFHIIKFTGTRAFDDADRADIRANVFNSKRQELFDGLFKKIGSRFKVTKNESLVKSLR